MKKFILMLIIFLFSVTFASCNYFEDKGNNDIENDDKDLVEVQELTFTNKDGVIINLNQEIDFYEAMKMCGVYGLVVRELTNKDFTIRGSYKFEETDTVNFEGNFYLKENASLLYVNSNYEGVDKRLTYKEYFSQIQEENNSNFVTSTFGYYKYGNDLAFGGSVYGYTNSENNKVYRSNEYPILPPASTEFGNIESRTQTIKSYLYNFSYFDVFPTLDIYNSEIQEYEKRDFDSYVQRSVKLYEDYVIFEQISPIAMNIYLPNNRDQSIYYLGATSGQKYYSKQTLKYNVKTNEVERLTIKGTFLSVLSGYFMLEETLDISIYINDLNEEKYINEVNELLEFIKTNCNN